MAVSVAGAQRPGNRRVTGKEQFYTPPTLAKQVVRDLLERFPELRNSSWLEPAGGTGTFIDAALAAGVSSVRGYDIEPHHDLVSPADFLSLRLRDSGLVSFGNPPFGRNNALSVPMFNACARVSDTICFIVPRSWRKWSVLNRLDRSFELAFDDDLQINYVDLEGLTLHTGTTLKTCVQTWRRTSALRPIVKVQDLGVIEKCSFDAADVSLTIFGYGCGTVKTEFPRKANTTQMFLRLRHPQALSALKSVDFSQFFRNVAYTEALAWGEINYLLNEKIFGDPSLVESADSDEVLFNL